MCSLRTLPRLLKPLAFACVVALACSRTAFAGGAYVTAREWHRQDGLPSEVVSLVAQDPLGFLWVESLGGLLRFDGGRFEPVQLPGLARNQVVQGLHTTAQGLWVVPREGAPLLVSGFEHREDPLPEPARSGAVIASFVQDDGTRWLALRGGRVVWLSADRSEILDTEPALEVGERLSFASDSSGGLWLVTERRLGRLAEGRFVAVDIGTGDAELRIASSRAGSPWIFTPTALLRLDGEGRTRVVCQLPALAGAHYVTCTSEARDGALWFGTRSQGLFRCFEGRVESVATSSESIRAIHEDESGNLWVGTNAGGLCLVRGASHRLFDRAAGLVENAAYAFAEAADGTVWCANGDGGLVGLRKGRVQDTGEGARPPGFMAVGVATLPTGELFLGGAPGLFRKGPDATSPVHVSGTFNATRLYADKAGRVWFAAGLGRIGCRHSDGYIRILGEAEGVPQSEARCFAEDEAGTIWVGTSRGEILRETDGRFVGVKYWQESLPGEAINAILFDGARSLWIGSSLRGVIIVRDGKIRLLDSSTGLPDPVVNHLVPDDLGHVWCGTATGVFRLSRTEVRAFLDGDHATVTPLRLGLGEGLRVVASSGIYFPGALKARDGTIWFATRQGALAVDPRAESFSSQPRRLSFELHVGSGRTIPLAEGRTLRVGPAEKALYVRVAVLCLDARERVRVEYRLDDTEMSWRETGPDQELALEVPGAGTHRLRVRARTGPREEGMLEGQLVFTVALPWWRAGWAQASAGCCLLLVVAFTARAISTRRLRRRLRDLKREHAVEQERARIARNIHDDVGASLTHISLLTQTALADNSPDKLRAIHETARDITRSLDEIVWAVNPRNDTLESFGDYLGGQAQRFLQAAGVRCRLAIPADLPPLPLGSQARHSLFLCCREALNNIAKHARACTATVSISIEGSVLLVRITDDGVGMPASHDAAAPRPASYSSGSGNGLRNMCERMHALGGGFTTGPTSDGRGTCVLLSLPLPLSDDVT